MIVCNTILLVCVAFYLLGEESRSYYPLDLANFKHADPKVICSSWRPSSDYILEDWYYPHLNYSQFPEFDISRRNIACPSYFTSVAWNRILLRLVTAKSFKTVVIGGSETAGIECENEALKGKACAWSARLSEIMKLAFPGKELLLYNVASGGTTITAALASLAVWTRMPVDSDLLLVDFIVNDSWETQDMSIGSLNNLFSGYERLIITVKKIRPDLEIVFVNTCSLEKCHRVNNIIKFVAGHHGIAVISYTDLAMGLAEISGQGDLPSVYWGTKNTHPPWTVHQLIGETVWGCIQQHWDAQCDPSYDSETKPLSSATSLEKLDTCDVPRSQFSAFAPPTTDVHYNEWALNEDRPGKPGWISTSYSSTISFNVTFGSHPRLVLTYLRSYTGLGTAEMWFSSIPERRLPLHGLYAPEEPQHGGNTSQSFLLIMNVQMHDFQPEWGLGGILGFGIAPFSTHTLNFRILGPDLPGEEDYESFKFKLITVQTC